MNSAMSSAATRTPEAGARHLTLAEFVLVQLRNRIVLGDLAPGSRVEVEKLARELGTSRIPVREAVRQLEAEGLVVSTPRKNVVVQDVNVQDIDDAYRLLETAELLAVKRLVKRITPLQLEQMRHWAEETSRLQHAPRSEAMLIAHRSFHQTMYEAIGDPLLLRHIRMLWYACERYVMAAARDTGERFGSPQEHFEYIKLLEKQELRGLNRHIREHVRASRERALAGLTV